MLVNGAMALCLMMGRKGSFGTGLWNYEIIAVANTIELIVG
jgi:hypothetical protein